jgi:galactose mutarotase-like enzyme
MWSADPAFWGKVSPVLFPIVGTVIDDTYYYKGKSYSLPRHGFARDHTFKLVKQSTNQISFSLASTGESLQKYPFNFLLTITYEIVKNNLEVKYDVKNTGDDEMLFSLGAHPAFKVPLVEGTSYDDYYFVFNKAEDAPRWPLSKAGFIDPEPQAFFDNSSALPITHELFYNEALVFKNLHSDKISIKSNKHSHGLDFHFSGFPFMGIWAAKDADFVCIEPWCGIADHTNHDQQLENKEGILKLNVGESWFRKWGITTY